MNDKPIDYEYLACYYCCTSLKNKVIYDMGEDQFKTRVYVCQNCYEKAIKLQEREK